MAEDKPVRIFTDMCADLFHWGHANAIRQSKLLGDVMVVALHDDEEIRRHKGPPVMTYEERRAVIESCRWVDEFHPTPVPYQTTVETLDAINIDYVAHGEEPTLDANGNDSYQSVKEANRLKTISRTIGISTTNIVGRMLLMTKDHFISTPDDSSEQQTNQKQQRLFENIPELDLPAGARAHIRASQDDPPPSPVIGRRVHEEIQRRVSQVSLPEEAPSKHTARAMDLFYTPKARKKEDIVVFVDGAFDLYHAGHVNAMRKARELGTYLLVGIHNDFAVNRRRGKNYPIMNVYERSLCVMSCKYADDVILGTPYHLTKEFIEFHKIDIVAHGNLALEEPDQFDPYRIPKEMGIFREFESTKGLTTQIVVNRIIEHRMRYEKRNANIAKKYQEKDLADKIW